MMLVSDPIPLNGFAMHLRRSEMNAVARGLGTFDTSEEGDLLTLVEALRRVPAHERAGTWELAVRHYGRGKPVPEACGDIGQDEIRARALLEAFNKALSPESPAA